MKQKPLGFLPLAFLTCAAISTLHDEAEAQFGGGQLSQVVQIVCAGNNSCCGVTSASRNYIYNVKLPGGNLVSITRIDIPTDDGNINNYDVANAIMPIGWSMSIVTLSPARPHRELCTPHGSLTSSGDDLTTVLRFDKNTGSGQTANFTLGYDHIPDAPGHDTDWKASNGNSADWTKVVGTGRGPIHAPGDIPSVWPVQNLLVDNITSIPITGNQNIVDSWDAIVDYADDSPGTVDYTDIAGTWDVWALANAIVSVRHGDSGVRATALANVEDAVDEFITAFPTNSSSPGNVIPWARNTLSVILAADIALSDSSQRVIDFKDKLLDLHDWTTWSGDGCNGTISAGCHDVRPNNHGLYAGATIIAIELYLEHQDHYRERRNTFKAWLGDAAFDPGFVFGGSLPDNSWQADSGQFRGINADCGGPTNCPGGNELNGCLPDDQRRAGECLGTSYPTTWGQTTGYVWEAMQGAVMQAHLISRAGESVWSWRSSAMKRAVTWLYDTYQFPPEDVGTSECDCSACSGQDDTWVPHITDAAYGTTRQSTYGGDPGKNCGFADWWALGL